MVDKVTTACIAEFPAHSGDCSGFVKAVGAAVGVAITGQANDIVDTLRAGGDWTQLANGPAAQSAAKAGKLVIGGLRGDEQTKPDANGHVVVVVDGPLNRNLYPTAYWGQLHGIGKQNETINWAWTEQDRDRVTYAAHDLA
jgi:hypothetical protein